MTTQERPRLSRPRDILKEQGAQLLVKASALMEETRDEIGHEAHNRINTFLDSLPDHQKLRLARACITLPSELPNDPTQKEPNMLSKKIGEIARAVWERLEPDIIRIGQTYQEEETNVLANEAQGLLYRRYLGIIFGFAHRLVGNALEAEDIVSQVFSNVVVADKLRNYKPVADKPFSALLFETARNLSYNSLRTQQRKNRRGIESFEEIQAARGDQTDDSKDENPSTFVVNHEERLLVDKAISMLSEDRRRLLALRYTAGLPHREIGERLGRTEGAIKVLLNRTIEQVREFLEGLYDGPPQTKK